MDSTHELPTTVPDLRELIRLAGDQGAHLVMSPLGLTRLRELAAGLPLGALAVYIPALGVPVVVDGAHDDDRVSIRGGS